MSTTVPDGVILYSYQWTCVRSVMLVAFNMDPMAGTGVGVGTGNVGMAVGDGLLLLVVVQPAIATAANKTQTNNTTLDDLHFMSFPPLERVPALKSVAVRLI
jgi:hypothetical protein